MTAADTIARYLPASEVNRDGQIAQIRYRLGLIEQWRIPEGARLLEIACGQGDMTVALADAVGPTGHVAAVDIADPAYGAPFTLGESAAHLKQSAIGDRMTFRFQTDLLDPRVTFADDAFDGIVLAHGGWYFADLDQLGSILRRVRPWSPRLYVAEWDLTPEETAQLPHLLAVLIQGQIEAFRRDSEANVRTPFSKERLTALLKDCGWDVTAISSGQTRELQDADWEVDLCLDQTLPLLDSLDIPAKLRDLIQSQGDIMRNLAERAERIPLPSYALTAERRSPELS